MLTKLIGTAASGGSMVVIKYIAIAWAIVTALLITTVIIEYAIIKGYQSDLTKLKAELTTCEEKKAELGKTVIVKDQDLASLQGRLTECSTIINSNITECSGILDAVRQGCEGLNLRYKTAWEACEARLKDCGGGVNEECSDFIKRSISPFYYGMH